MKLKLYKHYFNSYQERTIWVRDLNRFIFSKYKNKNLKNYYVCWYFPQYVDKQVFMYIPGIEAFKIHSRFKSQENILKYKH
jgi:hypothetical protein